MTRSSPPRISFVFGTRPEAIKLCPLVRAARNDDRLDVHICVTGQHREMLAQVLDAFQVTPDVDLNLMQPEQSLASFTARAIQAVDSYLDIAQPQLVIVQGDTTTTFCAALSAFYHRTPVAHVEAGLRTGDRWAPFPEEINRQLTTRLVDLHFAPTQQARQNLLDEGVAETRIHVTGNTAIDALQFAQQQIQASPPMIAGLPSCLQPVERLDYAAAPRIVLITGHRRENFGPGLQRVCQAIAHLARQFPDVHFVYPVHLNPAVRQPVFRTLGSGENVHLIEPLPYFPFIALLSSATLVVTDSGGIQEEAPALGKPVLVLRETTERPEGIQQATAQLVGTQAEQIIERVGQLLTDPAAYAAMARSVMPYGDGQASRRILGELARYLQIPPVHN